MMDNSTNWPCPNCNTVNLHGKFCRMCRTQRPQEPVAQTPETASSQPQGAPVEGWVCPQCGTHNLKGKFCRKCRFARAVEPLNRGTDVKETLNSAMAEAISGLGKIRDSAAARMPEAKEETLNVFNKLKSGGQTLVTKVKETAVEAKDMASELTQQNPADATKPNAKKRYCMECGAEIPVQAKFCQECGANQQ